MKANYLKMIDARAARLRADPHTTPENSAAIEEVKRRMGDLYELYKVMSLKKSDGFVTRLRAAAYGAKSSLSYVVALPGCGSVKVTYKQERPGFYVCAEFEKGSTDISEKRTDLDMPTQPRNAKQALAHVVEALARICVRSYELRHRVITLDSAVVPPLPLSNTGDLDIMQTVINMMPEHASQDPEAAGWEKCPPGSPTECGNCERRRLAQASLDRLKLATRPVKRLKVTHRWSGTRTDYECLVRGDMGSDAIIKHFNIDYDPDEGETITVWGLEDVEIVDFRKWKVVE